MRYNQIGAAERNAAMKVLKTGVLSNFYGNWSPRFFGGKYVQAIEKQWAAYTGARSAVAVNSATSGLQAAVGALEIGPGDEVIVSPYTMCASATAPLIYGAVPVFADVDPSSGCMTADSIAKAITPRTRAIILVHIFGRPADLAPILKLAKKRRLKLIEDCAQAAGAKYRGRHVGTFGDIGVFSLNCHKTIQSGEGGICITSDKAVAMRLKLIRNHAENVVTQMTAAEKKMYIQNRWTNLVGFNLRMTEIEAAIGIEQLKKLKRLNAERIRKCNLLTRLLAPYKNYLQTPAPPAGSSHVYYVYPLRFLPKAAGISRAKYAAYLKKRGVVLVEGYVRPIYRLDLFQKQIAIGKRGFPFRQPGYRGRPHYSPARFPVTERLYQEELLYLPMNIYDYTDRQIRALADCFRDAHEKVINPYDK